ncbi:hypothetical protein [uncultured Roseibium sp.]|uniref:hypothetical protein n=1 Tax=uncultured Roseibium sp. TaxID=1936171 RepID=UPI0026041BF9|nr:hypothetical protein [uncultured Roseibium sp.]
MRGTPSVFGQVDPPVSTKLTTTGQTDVFENSAQYSQTIKNLILVNEDTSNDIKVTLEWFDGSADETFFVGTIPKETTANFLDIPLYFSNEVSGQKIKATAGTANQITVTVIAVSDYGQQGQGG